MSRFMAVLVALSCGLLLSGCGLLPRFIFDPTLQTADARMEQIADALNDQDADALEAMFSPYALERATGFDEGMEYLLSFFPAGGVTWKQEGINMDGHNEAGKESTVILANYKVSTDGTDYRMFFADFTVNDVENPANVGVYALGVTPWTEARSDAEIGFLAWSNGIRLTSDGEYGYPGIYVPRDGLVYPSDQADERMEQITAALNSHDPAALTAMFSAPALQKASAFESRLASLFDLFADGGVTWEQYVVNDTGDETGKAIKLLTSYYTLSAHGQDYNFFFAEFVVDQKDPDNLGLASLAVTPLTEFGAPDQDQEFIDWTQSWDDDAGGFTGIYVPTG